MARAHHNRHETPLRLRRRFPPGGGRGTGLRMERDDETPKPISDDPWTTYLNTTSGTADARSAMDALLATR